MSIFRHPMQSIEAKGPKAIKCERCLKSTWLCVCEAIVPQDLGTKVLILQHPQEPKEDLSTAQIISLCLPNSVIKVGLSWRNLSKALGEDTDSKKWGVLFLGTVKGSRDALDKNKEVNILTPKGDSISLNQGKSPLDGIIALDGNWRQAKALWWRNPWLLKLNRIVLFPKTPSLYGRLRKEPRRESLSTLESVALSLKYLESNQACQDTLLNPFQLLLRKFSDAKKGRLPHIGKDL